MFVIRHRSLGSLAFVFHVACLTGTAGCGQSSNDASPSATGGAGQTDMSSTAGGNSSTATNVGGSGAATSSGGSSSSNSSEPPLNVPRVDNNEGDSVLDQPLTASTGGLCAGKGVYCNGGCLAAIGAAEGNCSVLNTHLGQTASMALTADALYYTAANEEILRTSLTDGSHTSIARGLQFVDTLTIEGNTIYFRTQDPGSFSDYDVRKVSTSGGDVTVLSQAFSQPAAEIAVVGDRLLFGIGNFRPYTLYSLPKAGGKAEPFGAIKGSELKPDGDALYYTGGNNICSTSIAAPAEKNCPTKDFNDGRFVLEQGYFYYTRDNAYRRTPVAGGTGELIQSFTQNTALLGRTPTLVVLMQADHTNSKLQHLVTMPIAGGTTTDLATFEGAEYQAMVANATDLYLAVGMLYEGAILRIKL